MGFRALFSGKASAPTINTNLQKTPRAEPSDLNVANQRGTSGRLIHGIRKAFYAHHGERDAQPTTLTASLALTPTTLYRFQAPTGHSQSEPAAEILSSSPVAEAGCSSEVAEKHYNPPTISASPITLPTATCLGSSTTVVNQSNVNSATSTSPTSPPTTADSSLSPIANTDTPTTTTLFTTSEDGTHGPRKTSGDAEYESAIDSMRDAVKILEHRHAVIGTKGDQEVAHKKSFQNILINTRLQSPKPSPRDIRTRGAHCKPRVAKLPAHVPHPSFSQRKQSETAQDACDALQRRQILRHLCYRGAGGCEEAIAALEELNAHYVLQARHQGTMDIPDLVLNFDGIHIRAGQLGLAERRWISRFNAVRRLQSLVDGKQLGQEDCEHIGDQLFPGDAEHILKPEYFAIFVTGLGLEGILTTAEANCLAKLQPSVQEYEAGARWTGKHQQQQSHDISTLAIFDIPKDARRGAATYSAHLATSKRTDLYHHLRILVEAAVYDQKFWKGYFFPNARSKVESFFQAHLAQQQRLPTTPNLCNYTRAWTCRERRLLERGQMICRLLNSFDNGALTDFGIVRAVRSSFIRLPGQGYWDAEELSTFLYHRVVDSGLELSMIPDILGLHHDYDSAVQKVGSRMQLTTDLKQRMSEFRAEEEQRLGEIEVSLETFAEMKKREMSKWQRFKKSLKMVFGKEQVVAPFDPFAQV